MQGERPGFRLALHLMLIYHCFEHVVQLLVSYACLVVCAALIAAWQAVTRILRCYA
jgi:hypothetical protein